MEEDLSGSSPSPPIFRNKYWILRHGRSVPNERGLIVSSLENGTKLEFGLAPQGVEQARSAGESLREELEEMGVPVDSVKIRYSPFSRTTETARVVAGVLGVPFDGPSCKAAVELRERYFGPSFELLSHEKYAEVWAVDEADPFMAPEGGESVADVASRLAAVLSSSDTEFHGSAILIVSHGDPLQIFQAVLSGTKENSSFLDEVTDLKNKGLLAPSVLSQHRFEDAEDLYFDQAQDFQDSLTYDQEAGNLEDYATTRIQKLEAQEMMRRSVVFSCSSLAPV